MRPFLRIYRKGKGNNNKDHQDTRTNKTRGQAKDNQNKADKVKDKKLKQRDKTKGKRIKAKGQKEGKHASSHKAA